jgi:hypothetical protein
LACLLQNPFTWRTRFPIFELRAISFLAPKSDAGRKTDQVRVACEWIGVEKFPEVVDGGGGKEGILRERKETCCHHKMAAQPSGHLWKRRM